MHCIEKEACGLYRMHLSFCDSTNTRRDRFNELDAVSFCARIRCCRDCSLHSAASQTCPTAYHCLRVAQNMTAWGLYHGIERDLLGQLKCLVTARHWQDRHSRTHLTETGTID